ncbi:hypothetical protein RIF29_24693 [Crotalaria pallida]|uniref:BHLH domain-containing protein n=1 Tax=Crotalaria pallida TaxID=3830 RepID=A0AAN9EK66_CROPI
MVCRRTIIKTNNLYVIFHFLIISLDKAREHTLMYANDFIELVMENGQIIAQGGSSSNRDAILRSKTLCSNSHRSNDQDDFRFSQNNESSSNKLEQEFAKESTNNSHLLSTYPSHESLLPSSKKLKYFGKCDQRPAKVVNNFSNFAIPKVFIKSTQPKRNNASLTKLGEIEAAKGSKGLEGFQDQHTSLNANKSNNPVVSLVARSDEESAPLDEKSEAVDHNNASLRAKGKAVDHNNASLRAKGKAVGHGSNLCNEPLLPSSVCSLEASNNPNFCITKHEEEEEDSDESTYFSDNDEEAEDAEETVVTETPARESLKRSRNGVIHHLHEKKRRDIMNKKMRTLKELIPNCNKVDKTSLLDDAIDYLKILKLQLQIMSMGSGFCMPHHQLMGAGMGFITPSTVGINPWSPPPQFPILPPLPSNDNNTLQNMFGAFSNQMPHIPIPHHAPNNFFPVMIGNSNNSSVQQLIMPITTPTNKQHHANSNSHLTTLDVFSYLHAKAESCGPNQAENQVSLNHIPGYPFYFPTNIEREGNNGKERKLE